MGILSRFRRQRLPDVEAMAAAADAKQQRAVAAIPLPGTTRVPQYPTSNYRDLAAGGYGKNEVVFACIDLLMKTFTEAPVVVTDANGERVPRHPLRMLLDRPNPFMTEQQLFETYVMHDRLAGNFFLELVRSSSGRVVELWPLRPDRVGIASSPDRYIETYLYELGGQTYQIPPRDVVHIRAPAPLNEFFGMAPLRAGLRITALDNELTDMTQVMAQNRGQNPGVAIVLAESLGEADRSQERVDRLLRRWRERYSGDERGAPAVLTQGMDVKTFGLTLNDLAWPDLRDVSEARICSVLNVPPIMVGVNVGLKRSTYANYAEARRSLWAEQVRPDHRKVASALGTHPDLRGDPGSRVDFDISQVLALADERQRAFDQASRGIKEGWLTVNEGRGRAGLEAVDGGDVFLRPINVVERRLEEDGEGEGGAGTPTSSGGSGERGTASRRPAERKAVSREVALAQVRLALGRRSVAEGFHEELQRFALEELRAEGEEALEALDEAAKARSPAEVKALSPDQREAVERAMRDLEARWGRRLAEKVRPVLSGIVETAAESASEEVGAEFGEAQRETVRDFVREYSFRFAQAVSEESADIVRGIMDRAVSESLTVSETRALLVDRFTESPHRATRIARTETIRASNVGAQHSYREAGVDRKRWFAADDACVYCAAVDGTVVGVDDRYFERGTTFAPRDTQTGQTAPPLHLSYEDVVNPPLHPNCRCTIIAELGD